MIRSEREEERESSLAFLALGVAHCGAVLGYQTGSECSMMTRAIKPELQLDIPDSLKLWQRDKKPELQLDIPDSLKLWQRDKIK